MASRQPGTAGAFYVHSDEVAHCWYRSMLAVARWDGAHGSRILNEFAIRYPYGGLVEARNFGAKEFLTERWSAEYLWWTDTDMGFAPDTVSRLLAAADPVKAPIVGALCFARKLLLPDEMGGHMTVATPTIYDWRPEDGYFVHRESWPDEQLVRCDGTGSACILIHHSVLEEIGVREGEAWYDPLPHPAQLSQPIGEDLSFCRRAAAAGFPVHVHTGVQTNHQKTVWMNEPNYRLIRAGLEATAAAPPQEVPHA